MVIHLLSRNTSVSRSLISLRFILRRLRWDYSLKLDDFEKKYRAARKPAQPLRNPCEISSELVFFTDKKVI